MATPGDHHATSRTRMENHTSRNDRYRNACRTPPRDGAEARRIREDACGTSLVGLVRGVSQRASGRQRHKYVPRSPGLPCPSTKTVLAVWFRQRDNESGAPRTDLLEWRAEPRLASTLVRLI